MKRLTFAPPTWYDVLVGACLIGGALLTAFASREGGMTIGRAPFLGIVLGVAVFFAGLWAALSNERMVCNLRTRTYSRFEGPGLLKRLTRGSLDELDAIVLLAEEWAVPVGGGRPVVYRLVLHWKGGKEPPLVVGAERKVLGASAPLGSAAGALLVAGSRYAKALAVAFYDNSYYASPCPIKPVR